MEEMTRDACFRRHGVLGRLGESEGRIAPDCEIAHEESERSAAEPVNGFETLRFMIY